MRPWRSPRVLIPLGLVALIGAAVLHRTGRSDEPPGQAGAHGTTPRPPVEYNDGRASRSWTATVKRQEWTTEEQGSRHPALVVPNALVVVQAGPAEKPLASARTDDQGRFRVEIPPPLETFWARVSAPGFLEERFQVTLEHLPSVVYLDQTGIAAGVVLKGTVRDAANLHGLGGARVFLDSGRQCRSKVDGQFELELAGASAMQQEWRLGVDLEGYASVIVSHARPSQPIDVALYRSVHVSGQVRDPQGAPLEGVRIQLRRCAHGPQHRTGVAPAALKSEDQEIPTGGTVTSVDGRYRLEIPLSPTDSFLVASAKGLVMATSPCLVNHYGLVGQAADMTYDFSLAKGLALRGRIENRFGQGIAGAQIWVDPPKTESTWQTETLISGSDEQGNFELTGLARGTYSGKVSSPRTGVRYRAGEFKVDPSSQDSITVVLEDELRPNIKVRISNRSPEQGKLYVVVFPVGDSRSTRRTASAILEPADFETTLQVTGGTYGALAYSVQGLWGEAGPFSVVENGVGDVQLVLGSGATVLVQGTPDRQAFDWSSECSLELWDELLKQWVELRYASAGRESPSPASREGNTLRIQVPRGKVRLLVAGKVIREFEVSGGQVLNLGAMERNP